MEKKTIEEKINVEIDWLYEPIEIKDFKDEIEYIEKLGATHIEFNVSDSFDSISIEVSVFKRRLETDEEYCKRLEHNKIFNDRVREQELKKLQELIEKYGL
jgi:hypothetical protein